MIGGIDGSGAWFGKDIRTFRKDGFWTTPQNTPERFGENIIPYNLGGGFKYFLFSPLPGEDEPILTIIFFNFFQFG